MVANILKFILGILLAFAILIGGGVAVGLYLMNRTSTPPTKPIFANDTPLLKGQNVKGAKSTSTREAKAKTSPAPTKSPTTSPKSAKSPKPLPRGAYPARVTWNQGLSLRSEPKDDTERIGGVGFNSKVIVLEESQDKEWQKIRLQDGEQEGWVKAGNTQKVDAEDLQQSEQAEQANQEQ